MTKINRIAAIIALTLVVGAVGAGSASAKPIDIDGPEFSGQAAAQYAVAPDSETPAPTPVADPGFDWGDAGIGGAAVFALGVVVLGGVLVAGRHHRGHQAAAA